MYKQVERTKDNTASANRRESRAVANSVTQKKSNVKKSFGFVDNRPEAVAQRKMYDVINNNSLKTQLKTIHGMANVEGVSQGVIQRGRYVNALKNRIHLHLNIGKQDHLKIDGERYNLMDRGGYNADKNGDSQKFGQKI